MARADYFNLSFPTLFKKVGALWEYSDNPKHPHALLTSGRHASAYFNADVIRQDSRLTEHVCSSLAYRLEEALGRLHMIQWVVGPAVGGIILAHALARAISHRRGLRDFPICLNSHVEIDQNFARMRIVPPKGARVLVVDDALSTGNSIKTTISTLESAGAVVLPIVAVLVNWSGQDAFEKRKVVSLVPLGMRTWSAQVCPLCQAGSVALRPKQHWRRFVGS